jgi:hypothetical protein
MFFRNVGWFAFDGHQVVSPVFEHQVPGRFCSQVCRASIDTVRPHRSRVPKSSRATGPKPRWSWCRPSSAQEELPRHGDGPQDRFSRSVAGFLAIYHDQLVGGRLAPHPGLDLEQALWRAFASIQPESGRRWIGWEPEMTVGSGADSQGATLALGEPARQLDQILLAPWGVAQHRYQHQSSRALGG